ncbi:MAG: hypothetical protein MZV70_50045 [Desulfobacterales bacterium]|nr:hypothetical protein [Desulfobacterales bacterium]
MRRVGQAIGLIRPIGRTGPTYALYAHGSTTLTPACAPTRCICLINQANYPARPADRGAGKGGSSQRAATASSRPPPASPSAAAEESHQI